MFDVLTVSLENNKQTMCICMYGCDNNGRKQS